MKIFLIRICRIALPLAALSVALVLSLARGPSGAANPPVKVVGVSSAQQGLPSVAVYWIGKLLGFQAQQGIDADMLTVAGGNAAENAQLVMSGKADIGITSLESVLLPASQGKNTGLVFVYNFYQRPTWRLIVQKGSGITSVAQLKGKPVGIPAPGNPAEPMLAAFLADAGLKLDDVQEQVVGTDAPAAQELKSGQISALLTVSLNSAVWEAGGFDFVALPPPKAFDSLVGASAAVSKATLADPAKRDAVIRYFRVWAMATAFAKANPAAAIDADYQMFPEVKPRDMTPAQAIAHGVSIEKVVMADYVNSRGKWGRFPPGALETYAKFLGVAGKIPDIASLSSNELIDAINTFDEKAVIEKAKTYHIGG